MGLRNNGDGDCERVDAALRITGDLTVAFEISIPDSSLSAWPANTFICCAGTTEDSAENNLYYLSALNGDAGFWNLRYHHENGAGVNNNEDFTDIDIPKSERRRMVLTRQVSNNTVILYLANPVTGLVQQETETYANDPSGGANTDFHLFATDQTQYMENFTVLAEVHVANLLWNAPEIRQYLWGYHGPMRGDVGYWPLDTVLGKVGGGEDMPLAASNLIIDRSGNNRHLTPNTAMNFFSQLPISGGGGYS